MKQIFYKLFENLKQLGIKPSIGSRTNVTPIPGSEIDRIINRPVTPKEFDYSKPEVVDSIRGIVKNASDYVGQFTERQAKTFNDNIERILNVIKPKETTAEVIDITTKEKITGPGLESLMKEKGVPSISRKTIEAETLIKQFLDDDLISLNAKQIDQLSKGKAEDVFEGIFGSKAKELITGKNTNESLNEVYNKLRTTKDVKGRLPDDPNFDPSDINFKDGGSVSEDVKQLLKEEFIKIINEDPEAYPDTNAGFRRFLKRKGAPVFNYKDGGRIVKRRQEKKDGKLGPTDPLSKYESYSEEELAGNIEAKKPTFETLEDYIMETMPMFVPRDVAPPKSYSPMPVEEYLQRRFFIDLADGGEVKSFEEQSLNKKGYETKGLTKKEIFDLYDSVMGTFSRRYKEGGEVKKRKRFADGGIASMFRERPGYQEGGNIIYKGDNDFFLNFQKGVGFVRGPNGWEFNGYIAPESNLPEGYSIKDLGRDENGNIIKEIFKDPNSTGLNVIKDLSTQSNSTGVSTPTTTEIPTVDPFSGQQISLQEAISLAEQMTPPTPAAGYTEEGLRKISEDTASRVNATIDAFNAGLYNQTPTVDPFSGQQVSAQDQLAFTQPQADIFPTINVGSSDPLTNILGSQVGNLSYSEMNALRNNPNTFLENSYNQAARAGIGLNSLLDAIGMGSRGKGLYSPITSLSHGTSMANLQNILESGFKGGNVPSWAGTGKVFGASDNLASKYGDEIAKFFASTANPTTLGGSLTKSGINLGMETALSPSQANKGMLLAQKLQSGMYENSPLAQRLLQTGTNVSPSILKNVAQSLPFVGAGLAGLDAYQRFGQGDYIGSALGAASAIPVLGLPATAAQVVYDIYNQSQNSPVVGFNQVQDPRAMMAYGGLTKTVPPAMGPDSQGVESLFTRRYN